MRITVYDILGWRRGCPMKDIIEEYPELISALILELSQRDSGPHVEIF